MRATIVLSLVALGLAFFVARGDDSLTQVAMSMGSHAGYIVSERYAEDHRADLIASIPGLMKVDGFWTPTESNVEVVDRVFRETIEAAAKDPSLLFPELANRTDRESAELFNKEKNELQLVFQNYDSYMRQYVGIVVDGAKLIFCNYADVPKTDPSADYIFIQRTFVDDGTVHFLQCRADPIAKTCSHVSMIGSWQGESK